MEPEGEEDNAAALRLDAGAHQRLPASLPCLPDSQLQELDEMAEPLRYGLASEVGPDAQLAVKLLYPL
jgi:hypothetical protein